MFIDLPSWRGIDINQDLLPGDVLRTNASGHLAVLFADNTQIRLARNTTLAGQAGRGGRGHRAQPRSRSDMGARRARRRRPDRRDAGRRRGDPRHRLVDDRRRLRQDLADRAGGARRALQRIRLGQRRRRRGCGRLDRASTDQGRHRRSRRPRADALLPVAARFLHMDAGLAAIQSGHAAATVADRRHPRQRAQRGGLADACRSVAFLRRQAGSGRRRATGAQASPVAVAEGAARPSRCAGRGGRAPVRRCGAAFQAGSAAARRQASGHCAVWRLFCARACRSGPRRGGAGDFRGRALRGTRRSLDRWIPEGYSGSDRRRQACRGALSGRPVAAGLSRTAGASHRRSRAGEGGHRPVARHRSGRPYRARGARQLQGRDRERSGGRHCRPDACHGDRTRHRRRSGTRSATS